KNNASWTKSQITREEAISMLVRSYEILNDEVIQPTSTATFAAKNNASIGPSYKNALAKAATIGMISKISNVKPKDSLTYGELFVMWSKLIK
ncbi:MAG: hypothetical protein H7X94_00840, partial [Vallitaleaceae bacterium]|nr:hypothetical protein [Vallitaleaceae bacterium]